MADNAFLEVSTAEPVDILVQANSRVSIEANASKEEEVGVELLPRGYAPSIAPYNGKYEVIPTVEGETLQTKNKYMAKDLTVQPIPYFEVGNLTGGTTVYIAGEINFE